MSAPPASAPSARDLTVFGFVLPACFAALGALLRGPLGVPLAGVVAWAVGILATLAYLALPTARPLLYRGWMAATRPLGVLVSLLVLGLVWLGILTPVSLLQRALGRDVLGKRQEPGASSYWTRHATTRDTRHYFRQF